MDSLFYGLTRQEFCSLVYQYAEANKIPHPFKNNIAGDDWYKSFRKRHPDLCLRQPEPTSVARARGFNRPQVERFFDLLEDQIDKNQVDVTRIYNVDETGIQTTSNKPPKVLTKTGQKKRQVGVISSVERGKLTTVVCCCNAAGSFIPPFMIFGRKRMNFRLLDGSPPGTVATCTDNGWISGPTFLEWLRHFVAVTRPTKEKKVILVMDNHVSHKYLPVLEYASENNVIFISLAPHTTHRTQPLDRCIYGPLKTYFEQAVSVFQRGHVGRIISQFDVAKLFGEAYLKAASPQNAVRGFESTGIWPTNRHIFSDADYLPSAMTDRPLKSNSPIIPTLATYEDIPDSSTNPLTHTTVAQLNDVIASARVAEAANIHEESECDLPIEYTDFLEQLGYESLQIPSHHTPPPTPRLSVDSDRTVSPSIIDQIILNSERSLVENVINSETVATVEPNQVNITTLTPLDIRPVPKQAETTKTARKRKIQKAEILTSTPIKMQQREIECKKQKAIKKKAANVTVTKKKVASKGATAPSSGKVKKVSNRNKKLNGNKSADDVICVFCHGRYTEPPNEDWIKCDDCQCWVHESCTDYIGVGAYFCDLCH
ncbi:unnamed protein product [Leptosia nina]|uniref:Zinc finger PHD-type domain-containing protein n=1 Tax=Leptosia nina TaxID=320188 RepID=A0AAV1JYI5_9NEOP